MKKSSNNDLSGLSTNKKKVLFLKEPVTQIETIDQDNNKKHKKESDYQLDSLEEKGFISLKFDENPEKTTNNTDELEVKSSFVEGKSKNSIEKEIFTKEDSYYNDEIAKKFKEGDDITHNESKTLLKRALFLLNKNKGHPEIMRTTTNHLNNFLEQTSFYTKKEKLNNPERIEALKKINNAWNEIHQRNESPDEENQSHDEESFTISTFDLVGKKKQNDGNHINNETKKTKRF